MVLAGFKRAGGKILVAGAAMLVIAGCDNGQNQADKQTRSDLTEAQQKIDAGPANAAAAQFTAAAQNAAASAGLRAAAKAALAQSELQAGQNIVSKIDKDELDLAATGFEITQLANQISAGGREVAAAKQYDPKPAKDAIAAAIAEAQGGPDKPAWFSGEGGAVLPTLAAAKDAVTKLQTDLSQKQDQVKNLTQQRGVLLDQAEQASNQADQAKDNAALDLFKRASDLRRQAGELSIQIDTTNNEIAKIQNNLGVAQAQESAVSDAIKQLQDQIATMDKTWQEIDSKASEHQHIAEQILGSGAASGASTAGGSIAAKAAKWDQLVKQIRTQRRDAETQLGNAAQHFDEARKAAEELVRDLMQKMNSNQGSPDLAAWQNTKTVMDPAQFRLQYATAQRALGELHLSEAISASQRASLVNTVQTALSAASLSVPPQLLAGDAAGERANALKSADAALKESDDSLNNIINGRSDLKDIATTAQVAKALTDYDWSQVAKFSGDAQAAKQHLTDAITARNEAAAANATIPPMPAEMGQPPKPAGETAQADSTTQPATAPAAQ